MVCASSAPLDKSVLNSPSSRLATSILSQTRPHAEHSSTGTPTTSAVRFSRSARRERRAATRSPLSQATHRVHGVSTLLVFITAPFNQSNAGIAADNVLAMYQLCIKPVNRLACWRVLRVPPISHRTRSDVLNGRWRTWANTRFTDLQAGGRGFESHRLHSISPSSEAISTSAVNSSSVFGATACRVHWSSLGELLNSLIDGTCEDWS